MAIPELKNTIFEIKIHWVSSHPLEVTEEGVSEPKDRAVEIFFLKNRKKKDLKNWTEKNEKSLRGLCDISKNV